MKKNKIIIKQRIGLIILGIFLALVLLEVSLRVSGYIMMSMQRIDNVVGEDDEYVILCLGESTTANLYNKQSNWPNQLEIILNERIPDIKFSVINEGISSIETDFILTNIDSNIEKYNPDMVITMMGINDGIGEAKPTINEVMIVRIKNVLRKIKVYKLGELIYLNIKEKLKNQNREFADLGWVYMNQGRYEEAERMLKKAIEINPKNEKAYGILILVYGYQDDFNKTKEIFDKGIRINPNADNLYDGMGWVYKNRGNYEEAERMLKKAIEINPKNEGAYSGLRPVYEEQGRFEEAEELFIEAIGKCPSCYFIYIGLGGLYKEQGRFEEAEELFIEAINANPKEDWLYTWLGGLYKEQGRFEEAKGILNRAKKIRTDYKNIILKENYLRMYEKLTERKIRFLVMGYPTRSINEFKDMFDKSQQKDIIFIENKENFEEALENASYDDIFIDRFAGDFGHCTLRGNLLIAENVADAILDNIESN